jgi:hypothetical protein
MLTTPDHSATAATAASPTPVLPVHPSVSISHQTSPVALTTQELQHQYSPIRRNLSESLLNTPLCVISSLPSRTHCSPTTAFTTQMDTQPSPPPIRTLHSSLTTNPQPEICQVHVNTTPTTKASALPCPQSLPQLARPPQLPLLPVLQNQSTPSNCLRSPKIARTPRTHPYGRRTLTKQIRHTSLSASAIRKETALLVSYWHLLKHQHTSTTALPNPYTPSETSEYTSMEDDDDLSLSSAATLPLPTSTAIPSSIPPSQ